MTAGSKLRVRVVMIVVLLFEVLAYGCGYTLQGRETLPFDSVSLGTIENRTVEPKLQDKMSRLLAETLMEYGVDVRPAAADRIEGAIVRFDLIPVSEKSLTAIEYQVTIVADFKIVDSKTKKLQVLAGVSSPFVTYFRSSGALVSVLALKEAATESALKDLSLELVRHMIYKKPLNTATMDMQKGDQKNEPQTVPAGK